MSTSLEIDTLSAPARTIHTSIGLGETGDTTLGWDAENDSWVLPLIQAKMDEGYEFWIIRRRPVREEQLRRVSDIGDARHIVIRDGAARELLEDGRIQLLVEEPEPDAPLERTGRAHTAQEAVRNDTLAHRPLRGG